MRKYIKEHIGNYTFDSLNKSITIKGVKIDSLILKSIINTTTNDVIHNKDKNGNHYVGKSYVLSLNVNNEDVITFNTDNTNMSDSDNLLIELDVDVSNSINETNKYSFEDTTEYSVKDKGLKELFTTTKFFIEEDGRYEIKISCDITNEDDDKGCEIYTYLDNDENNLALKIVGFVVKEMEYHTESNFKFCTLTKGTHSMTVYLETTKNKKEAFMKNYQLQISKS